MADLNLDQAPGGSTSTPVGGRFYITIGGVDYYIDYTDLVSLLDDDIYLNQLDIADLQTDVTTLQDLTSKRADLNATTFSWNLPADSCITGFVFQHTYSTPNITITSGSDTIVSTKVLNGTTVKILTINTMFASENASTANITVTITSGRANIITFYKTNLTT